MRAKVGLLFFVAVGAMALTGCGSILNTGIEQSLMELNSHQSVSAQAVTNKTAAFPEQSDPSFEYIGSVQATSEGLTLLLRPKGLEKAAASYNGASEIAHWAIELYNQISEEFRPYDDIGFLSMPLAKEVYYHALGYKLWPEMHNKTNPIKSRFSEYWTNQGQWMWWFN